MARGETRKPAEARVGKKSEAISIRVDPVSRYGLEILARLENRPLSGYVELLIRRAFGSVIVGNGESIQDVINATWSPNEHERLIMMGIKYPQFLSYEDGKKFKVITETPALWSNRRIRNISTFRWSEVSKVWPQIEDAINTAANRPIVIGLPDSLMREVGLLSMDDEDLSDIPF